MTQTEIAQAKVDDVKSVSLTLLERNWIKHALAVLGKSITRSADKEPPMSAVRGIREKELAELSVIVQKLTA